LQVYGFLEKAQMENVSADLSNTLLGLFWYNTTDNKMKIYDGAVRAMVSEDGAATLTNKIFSGGTITGAAISGGTLSGIDINLGAATDANKLVVSSETRANLEALTREAGSVYYSSDEQKYLGDDGLNLVEFGSGSGTGINYVDNPDAESNTDGHVAYKDSANEVPDDGIGGAPTLAVARSTVAPLVGKASFVITKPASNVQGEGIKVANDDFAEADKGKIQIMSFEYDLSDANANDGDFRVYFKDETNSVIYRVNGEDVKAGKGTHYARVQIPIDCDNGSLIIHCAATHADGYDFKYDRVSFGPQKLAYGTIVEDWKEYTPTFGAGFGSVSNISFRHRRVGDNLEIIGYFSAGTIASSFASVSLPSGLSLDTVKLTIPNNTNTSEGTYVGDWEITEAVDNSTGKLVTAPALDDSLIYFGQSSRNSANGLLPAIGTLIMASNEDVAVRVIVPIAGWSSQSQTSEDFGGRDVIVTGKGNGGESITASTTDITFNAVKDTTASWNGNQFTAPEKGFYSVAGHIQATTNISGSIDLYVNNVRQIRIGRWATTTSNEEFNGYIFLEKGDIMSVRMDVSFTLQSANSFVHWIAISKLASSQQILETELVAARYTSDSGQNINNATLTTLVYEDLVADTHNAYNTSTGVYTVPVIGWYEVKGKIRINSMTTSFGTVAMYVIVDSVQIDVVDRPVNSQNSFRSYDISTKVYLEKGQELEVAVNHTNGGNRSLNTSSNRNVFSIVRLK